MNELNKLTQKYRQASWRTQSQWLGLILLGVVVVAMVAGIYLSVSNQATTYGNEILGLNYAIARDQRTNAELQTDLAELNSAARMQERADDLGYEPIDPGDIIYAVVPGYTPDSGVKMGTTAEELPASIILPEYKETLFDWLANQIQDPTQVAGAQP